MCKFKLIPMFLSMSLMMMVVSNASAQQIALEWRAPTLRGFISSDSEHITGLRLIGGELGVEHFGVSVRGGAAYEFTSVGLGHTFDLRFGVPVLEHDWTGEGDLLGRIVPAVGASVVRLYSESREDRDDFPIDLSVAGTIGARYELNNFGVDWNGTLHGIIFSFGAYYHHAFIQNARDNDVGKPIRSFIDVGLSVGYVVRL